VVQRLPRLDRVTQRVMIAAVPLIPQKMRVDSPPGVTVCSQQQCQLAHGGPRFQFREGFRPLGQLIDGGLAGAEHSGREEPEHLPHDAAL
jgi:hypothetical protein